MCTRNSTLDSVHRKCNDGSPKSDRRNYPQVIKIMAFFIILIGRKMNVILPFVISRYSAGIICVKRIKEVCILPGQKNTTSGIHQIIILLGRSIMVGLRDENLMADFFLKEHS